MVQGYSNKTVIDPSAITDFPLAFARNLSHVLSKLESNDEVHYIKGLADPFHPSVSGVRVPMPLPRDTVTYSSYGSTQFSATAEN